MRPKHPARPPCGPNTPPGPPPGPATEDDKYNCISNVIGGGNGGSLTSPGGGGGGTTAYWVPTGDGVTVFDDDCWVKVEPCDIGFGVPGDVVVVITEGPIDQEGNAGEAENVAHATKSNGDGTFDDKNGNKDREPGKPGSAVEQEHTTDKGFTDADGDGTFENADGSRWRRIECYEYDEDCIEEQQ